jgi:hypothetical protein
MKRSEMEHKVKEWLLTNGGTQTVDIPGLLDFLESKGMLPPAYEKLVEAKLVEAKGIVSPSPEMKWFYKMPCNEWEAE